MIKLARRVVRQTSVVDPRSRRPLVIELAEGGLGVRIREKGRQHGYFVPYSEIYLAGARIRAQEIKAAKDLARKSR
jgi:hypothetical protein